MPQTIVQKRAQFAYEKVSTLRHNGNAPSSRESSFRTRLIDLGTQLHTNGLGQTVAFYMSKENKEEGAYRETLIWLRDWLAENERNIFQNPGQRKLIDLITQSDAIAYRKASVEAKEIALWFKRFAEATLRKQPDQQEN